MNPLSIPRVLILVSCTVVGCSPAPAVDASTDVAAETDSTPAPVCRFDPERPATDPCESANLGGEVCVFNRDADGGIECFLV
jgi:hypothetical protein